MDAKVMLDAVDERGSRSPRYDRDSLSSSSTPSSDSTKGDNGGGGSREVGGAELIGGKLTLGCEAFRTSTNGRIPPPGRRCPLSTVDTEPRVVWNSIGEAVDAVDFDLSRMCDSDRCRWRTSGSGNRRVSERAVTGVSLDGVLASPGRDGSAVGRPKVLDSSGRSTGEVGDGFDIVRVLPSSIVICAAVSKSAA